MSMPEFEKAIEKYVDLMEIKNRQLIPPSEAEYRASLFLTACAHVTNWKSTYTELLNGAEARRDVQYKIAIFQANGKNVTEAKIIAEATPDYQDINKKVKELEAKVEYFQQYYQIFNNAHIFYRQMASQIHKEAFNAL